jgi:hypothetical protein
VPLYKVIVEGRRCLMSLDSVAKRIGFFATRFQEGADAAEASARAIDSVCAELHGRLLNGLDDPPVFSIDTLVEVDRVGKPNAGFTFYPDET